MLIRVMAHLREFFLGDALAPRFMVSATIDGCPVELYVSAARLPVRGEALRCLVKPVERHLAGERGFDWVQLRHEANGFIAALL